MAIETDDEDDERDIDLIDQGNDEKKAEPETNDAPAAPVQFSVTKKDARLFTIIVQDERQIIRSYDVHRDSVQEKIEHELAQIRTIR